MRILNAFFLLLICLTTHAFSQEMQPMADAAPFLKKLKEAAATTQTIKADFTEEKFVSYLKEPNKSTGVFYYKKQNKLRWEKLKPQEYIFLVNGDAVKVKEAEKEKSVSSFNEAIGKIKDLMIMLVNGEFQDNKIFAPSYFQNEEQYFVKLVPKNKTMANIFDHLQLTFSKKTMRLKELAFFEKSGDKSIITFYNDVINENLDDSLFTNF